MKLMMSRNLLGGLLGVALTGACLGNGYRLPDQDAEATARGESFAATADNPSAIYYNPAGITQLPGHNVRFGVYGLTYTATYKPATGGEFDSDGAVHVIPQVFYTYSAESLPLSFGLGFYAPFGLGVEWPENTGFRSLALKSDMAYMTLNPVVAWRILTNLSIAIGPTINYSDLELKQGVTSLPGFDQSVLKGNAMDYGFNAGVMWLPFPSVSLGAVYRAKTEMNYDGSTDTSFALPVPGVPQHLTLGAQAKVPFPQSAVVGLSYRPTPKWNIEFDVDWTDWDQVGTITVEQVIPSSLALEYKSSLYYELGATYHLDDTWHVSAGYIFNENSVPNRTFNPLVPDQARQYLSVGAGYRKNHLRVDVAYQFGWATTRTVQGSMSSSAGQNADGKYDYRHHGFAVSAGWQF